MLLSLLEDISTIAAMDGLVDLLVGVLSCKGSILSMIPMDISINPVPCCSVKGFVKIKYDNSNVTAFLAVVICSTKEEKCHNLSKTRMICMS